MGEVFLVVADDLDVALLQLVTEHDQGAVQPCMHVDFPGGRLVHVRVRLDRPDQLRDARRRTLDLPQQLVTGHCRPQPAENAAERFFRQPFCEPFEPGGVQPGAGECGGDLPPLLDASWKAPRASAALRPIAAAGLFSSWARPAAMVPSEISLPCCCETDSSDASRTSDLPQVLVDELDGDCALADGRGAALDRAVTHVTSDEDAWHARLQKERVPIRPPALGTLTPWQQVRSREDKPTCVALYDATEPLRLRRSPDKDEERMGRRGLGFARRCVLRGYPFQVIFTLDRDHSCVDQYLDIVPVFYLAHQVIGHAIPQVAAPAEDKDSARLLGEEHRGLAGRVRPPDDEYVLAPARKSFRLGCAVVDAAPREMINTWHIQFPVGDACRDDQGVARDLCSVRKGHDAVRVLGAQRAHLLGRQDLDLETLRLVHGPPRQIAARKPGREAQIVLDAAAHSGLPARGLALYEDGLQAL